MRPVDKEGQETKNVEVRKSLGWSLEVVGHEKPTMSLPSRFLGFAFGLAQQTINNKLTGPDLPDI